MTSQMQGEILFRGWEGGEDPGEEGEWGSDPGTWVTLVSGHMGDTRA